MLPVLTTQIRLLKSNSAGVCGKMRFSSSKLKSDNSAMVLKKKATVEDINAGYEDAAENPLYSGVLGATSDPVVSSDFIGDPRSAIVDLQMTRVVDGDLVKVMAWYDNEWGYSNRLVEQVIALGKSTG